LTGIAVIRTVSLPSNAVQGSKVTLSLTFENIGDEKDQFWVGIDEYEGDITMNIYSGVAGATALLQHKRLEGYYTPGQIGSFYRDIVMPHKDKWQLRLTIGHYSDAAKTVPEIDDYRDLTVLRSGRTPLDKSWKDSIS